MTFKIESLKTKNSEILTNENDIESEEIYADVKSSSQICASCQFENKPNATFCGGCGKPLGDIICTNCQFENPNIASFCEGCGKELATS
jgi:ribosomal protein L40E